MPTLANISTPAPFTSLSSKLHSGYFSFEFFPPRTDEGTTNLLRRISSLAELGPLYIDVTSAPRNRSLALDICSEALQYCGVDVMLHVTCAEWTPAELRQTLEEARQRGIRNIMCLRGDSASDALVSASAFATAADLVTFVRKEFGHSLCIAVAGYPEGCQGTGRGSAEYEADLRALRAKVEAGADFVVTQLFFSIDLYFAFVDDCRAQGIKVPIIPGVMPVQLFKVFQRTTQFLKTRVPQQVLDALEPIRDDDAKVRAYGIELAVQMAAELVRRGAPGVHFFTLNLERSVGAVVEQLQAQGVLRKKNALPWKQSAHEKRAGEDVRPIFWSNKPKSYVHRTQAWDEFPNGRWGDASSPAFGELNGSHYYNSLYGSQSERKLAWGEAPLTVRDLSLVFCGFVKGQVPFLPWSESGLALETGAIRDALVELNRNGILTINSQPRVNAASSTDPAFGWGPPNGYVYQKAYVEFFICAQGAKALAEIIEADFPSLSFMALNFKGDKLCNRTEQGAMAVTWGVFPGREVIQPTVVDPVAFVAWKDEAFELWTAAWASIYEEGSASHNLIWEVHDTFYLMHVVDDDYISGNVWSVFRDDRVVEAARIGLAMSGVL